MDDHWLCLYLDEIVLCKVEMVQYDNMIEENGEYTQQFNKLAWSLARDVRIHLLSTRQMVTSDEIMNTTVVFQILHLEHKFIISYVF